MGIGFSIGLLVLGSIGLVTILLREIYLLTLVIDEAKKSNILMHERMSEKLADVEVEKIFLEDKINQLEETVSLWQGQSRRLTRQVSTLNMKLDTDFDDDNETRESLIKIRSVA